MRTRDGDSRAERYQPMLLMSMFSVAFQREMTVRPYAACELPSVDASKMQ
jgi:hypothetical protein